MPSLLRDAEKVEISSRGHRWITSWHPPANAPDGAMYGAAGVCVSGGEVIVISTDASKCR